MNGYDISGYGRSIGPLVQEAEEVDVTAHMADTVKGYMKGHYNVNVGTYNGVFDNTATTGAHTVLRSADVIRNIVVAYGIRAVPAEGDPAFCGSFRQSSYQVSEDGGAVTVNANFLGWDATAASLNYGAGWGYLVHPSGAETAVNAGTGFDCYQQDETTHGGYFIYHLLASNAAGTATVSVDDSANNAAFLALAGATSGAIGFASFPTSGVIPLAVNATVRRYLRWQLALAGGMTTCTFVSAFVRG
jgi:hypothetical protein